MTPQPIQGVIGTPLKSVNMMNAKEDYKQYMSELQSSGKQKKSRVELEREKQA
jgi:hypothetical protein